MITIQLKIIHDHYYNYDESSEYHSFKPIVFDETAYSIRAVINTLLENIIEVIHGNFKIYKIEFYPIPKMVCELDDYCLATFKTADGEEFTIQVTANECIEFKGKFVYKSL